MSAIYAFTVRTEDGKEHALYVETAARAAVTAELRSGRLAVLVRRIDEPLVRERPGIVSRLLRKVFK